MKRLYDILRGCAKEEEVKAEFCKFFKMKIFALRGIDHYTEHVLFEFKYDRNFKNAENVARVLAQAMYYARLLKFGAGLTRYPLPPVICVVDKNEAFFAETKNFAKFYAAKGEKYDWDRAPSTPCPRLVGVVRFGGTAMSQRSFDCNSVSSVPRPNGWPSNPKYPNRWRHSDMKDVAYFFNFKFYDKAVEKGSLK